MEDDILRKVQTGIMDLTEAARLYGVTQGWMSKMATRELNPRWDIPQDKIVAVKEFLMPDSDPPRLILNDSEVGVKVGLCKQAVSVAREQLGIKSLSWQDRTRRRVFRKKEANMISMLMVKWGRSQELDKHIKERRAWKYVERLNRMALYGA